MDPVVYQFAVGAVVPGLTSTLAFAAAWMARPATFGRTNFSPAAGAAELDDILAKSQGANTNRIGGLVPPLLVAAAVLFAQLALTNGFSLKLPPTDAFGSLGLLALAAGGFGAVAVLANSAIFERLLVLVCLGLGGYFAKLSPVMWGVYVPLGILTFEGLRLALGRAGSARSVFAWAWCVVCSQTLILAFSSLRLGVLVHCLAAIMGGAMLIALLSPRLKLGVGAAVALGIFVPATLAQAFSLGAEDTPQSLRIAVIALLTVTPLWFALTAKVLLHKRSVPVGLLVLAIGGLPAIAAMGLAGYGYSKIDKDSGNSSAAPLRSVFEPVGTVALAAPGHGR